jgi:hypothetical protein
MHASAPVFECAFLQVEHVRPGNNCPLNHRACGAVYLKAMVVQILLGSAGGCGGPEKQLLCYDFFNKAASEPCSSIFF